MRPGTVTKEGSTLYTRCLILVISITVGLIAAAPAQSALTVAELKAHLSCDTVKTLEMPPFGDDFAKTNQASYKIHFMADNYPGQEVNGTVYPHPLYGTYALSDYINSYESAASADRKRVYETAIRAIVKAALCHMEEVADGGLAAYYDEPYIAHGQKRFYSSLTQAQYLLFIFKAGQITGDSAATAAAELMLKALELPEADGGVVFSDPQGNAIPQEYPGDAMHPPLFVLNGWMDTLLWLTKYWKASESAKADALLKRFTHALAENLRKYDAPSVANSFYKLSEIAQINLVDIIGGEIEISNPRVVIPGVGTYPISYSENFDERMFKNIFFGSASALVGGKIHLSNNANAWSWLSLYPTEGNILEFEAKAVRDSAFYLRILTGKPLMRGGGKTDLEWVDLTPQTRLAAGESKRFRISLPVELIAHATQPVASFKPFTVGGEPKFANVYHYLHISQLCRLASVVGNPAFRELARTWEKYVQEWSKMPLYNDPHLDLRRTDIILGLKDNPFFSCGEGDGKKESRVDHR
jgi:D-glucuronyl C5-epimerase C-terminus